MNYMQTQTATQQGALQQSALMAAAPAPIEPSLVDIGKIADCQIDRLRDLLGRFVSFNDRVLGARPDSGAVGPTPVPNGLVDELRMKQAAVSNLIDALMEQADRLNQIA